MGKTALWIVTILLDVFAFFLMFFMAPGGKSELASRGVRGTGTVILKDTQQSANGAAMNMITFEFLDAQNKNHRINRQMFDEGRFNSLSPKQDINVLYLPENQEIAATDGMEGLSSPKAGAFNFVAWSAIIASFVTGYMAIKSQLAGPKPAKSRGITMTRR